MDRAGLFEGFLISYDTPRLPRAPSPPPWGSSVQHFHPSLINWWPPALRQINPGMFKAL